MVDENIPTNLRLLLIVEEMAAAGVPISPLGINEKLDLPKPTLYRLFATLEEEGFIQRNIDGRHYSPGPRLRKISTGIISSLHIRTARQAVLKRLSTTIGETCNIAYADRDSMVYLERYETEWPLRIQLPTGTHVPFYCTASGKMYLSFLADNHLQSYVKSTSLFQRTPNTIGDAKLLLNEIEEIRQVGYAFDREEFIENMIAVAVPILDENQRLMATLSFHAPIQRITLEAAQSFLPLLQGTANELSLLAGAH